MGELGVVQIKVGIIWINSIHIPTEVQVIWVNGNHKAITMLDMAYKHESVPPAILVQLCRNRLPSHCHCVLHRVSSTKGRGLGVAD